MCLTNCNNNDFEEGHKIISQDHVQNSKLRLDWPWYLIQHVVIWNLKNYYTIKNCNKWKMVDSFRGILVLLWPWGITLVNSFWKTKIDYMYWPKVLDKCCLLQWDRGAMTLAKVRKYNLNVISLIANHVFLTLF